MFLPMSWTSPFDRGHDDLAVAALDVAGLLLGLDERDQVGDGLLHHPRGLHHLRQEHLPGAEQVADDVHAVHQRALDDLDRPAAARADLRAQLLGVVLDELVDALHQRVGDPLPHRQRPPLLGRHLLDRAVAGEVAGDLQQPLGAVRTAVEDHVLDALAQQLRAPRRRPRAAPALTMPMSMPGRDRVEQEDGVDGLAHGVVAAEGERDVRDAAGDQRAGQVLLDPAGGLDEVQAVVRVLLDARGDGEDVRVEDDVLGREADLLGRGCRRRAGRSACGARGCRPGRPRRRP